MPLDTSSVTSQFASQVVARARGRPVLAGNVVEGKDVVTPGFPSLAAFMAAGIKLGAAAFYTSASPVIDCLSAPSLADLSAIQTLIWTVERAVELAAKLGIAGMGAIGAAVATLADRYPRPKGDAKEAENLSRAFALHAPGEETVAFVVQGVVHAHVVPCKKAVRAVLDQLEADMTLVHQVAAPVRAYVRSVTTAAMHDVDRCPEFAGLGCFDDRFSFIKHRYGTTNKLAGIIEEKWFYRGGKQARSIQPAASSRIFE
jgi:hypothetical protein